LNRFATAAFCSVIELVPEPYVAPLDLLAIFGRAAPLQVDLGCGDGSFLCELAQRYPDKDFLGIDRLVGRVAKACRKSAALENVRILNVESSYAVGYLLPEESVEIFYLLFPDPWPKRRHQDRRIVTPAFLDSIHCALEDGGSMRIATDQFDYFSQIKRIAQASSLQVGEKLDGFKPSSLRRETSSDTNGNFPVTKFERRFSALGAPIYRLALRKISPVR
jgi:tRNA (guanine-N7-)-methyltransferase